MDDAGLAAYQAALLEALDRAGSAKDAKDALSENEMCPSYVQGFDLRMIELGMHLVRKWGKRR